MKPFPSQSIDSNAGLPATGSGRWAADESRAGCPPWGMAASAGCGRRPGERSGAGFTLLEVIVAFAVFFLVAFSILELTTRSLAAARSLQEHEPDTGLIAAMLSLTNKFEEGFQSGDFEDLYPGMYAGWHWASDVTEVWSNGLFRADIVVHRDVKKGPAVSTLSVLFYRPDSPPGKASTAGLGF
jgi:hypothetical protein